MIVKKNRLIADDGMKLVSVDNFIAEEVWLSPSDSIANWKEITEEEAQIIEAEREEAEREEAEIEDNVVE